MNPTRIAAYVIFVACIWNLLANQATALQTPSTGSIELVAQSAWVDPGGLFNLQVRVAGASTDASIRLDVYDAWPDAESLRDRAIANTSPLLSIDPTPLDELQSTSNEILLIELEVNSRLSTRPPSDTDDTPSLSVPNTEAIFPVEVTLLDKEGTPTDSLVTNIIVLPRSSARSPLATVLLLQGPNAVDQRTLSPTEATNQEVQRLSDLLNNLALHPRLPAAIDIDGELLVNINDLSDANDLISRLRERLDRDQVLPSSYVDVDEQALVDAGMTQALVDSRDQSANAATAILGFAPNPSIDVLERTLDPSGLKALADMGLQGALVEPDHLQPLDADVFEQAPYGRFILQADDGTTVPALRIAREFDRLYDATNAPVLDANWLLAELTNIAIQQDTSDDVRNRNRTVVLAPPYETQRESDFTKLFLNVLLNGLERIPALRPTSAHSAMSSTDFIPASGPNTISPPLRRILNPRSPDHTIEAFRAEHSQAQQAIDSWATVIEGDPQSIERLNTVLSRSTATGLTTEQRVTHIESIYNSINAQKDNALTIPDAAPITVTGQNTEVPIVLENNLNVDLSVVLLLDSEKLTFSQGAELATLLTPGTNRIDVPVTARASGDSPIRIQILSPDRTVFLASSDVLIRIFAFSGVGLAIGAGAIAVLTIWWLRQRRNPPTTMRETLEPQGTTS